MNREREHTMTSSGRTRLSRPDRYPYLGEPQVALGLVPGLITVPGGRIRQCVLRPDPGTFSRNPASDPGPSHLSARTVAASAGFLSATPDGRLDGFDPESPDFHRWLRIASLHADE